MPDGLPPFAQTEIGYAMNRIGRGESLATVYARLEQRAAEHRYSPSIIPSIIAQAQQNILITDLANVNNAQALVDVFAGQGLAAPAELQARVVFTVKDAAGNYLTASIVIPVSPTDTADSITQSALDQYQASIDASNAYGAGAIAGAASLVSVTPL